MNQTLEQFQVMYKYEPTLEHFKACFRKYLYFDLNFIVSNSIEKFPPDRNTFLQNLCHNSLQKEFKYEDSHNSLNRKKEKKEKKKE